jgi:hypothetical protein
MHAKLKSWVRFQEDSEGRPLPAEPLKLFNPWLGEEMRCAFDGWRVQEPVISLSSGSQFDVSRDMVQL